MHQHIKAAITIDILKRQCDWYKVLPISHEGRAGVTQGLGYITPGISIMRMWRLRFRAIKWVGFCDEP